MSAPRSIHHRLCYFTANAVVHGEKGGGLEKKFYAVKAGHNPGIYSSWGVCLGQINGFKNAQCKQSLPLFYANTRARVLANITIVKSFSSFAEADLFLRDIKPCNSVTSTYYAVQKGRIPGVYKDWESAQLQVKGFSNAKCKRFRSVQEAEVFVG